MADTHNDQAQWYQVLLDRTRDELRVRDPEGTGRPCAGPFRKRFTHLQEDGRVTETDVWEGPPEDFDLEPDRDSPMWQFSRVGLRLLAVKTIAARGDILGSPE